MRLLEINVVCGVKSTGRIATEIAKEYENRGYEVKIAYGRDYVPAEYERYAVRIGNKADVYFHALLARVFDNAGFFSKHATRHFLKWADEYNPDVLWLHNLHGYYINLPILFEWIKSRPNMEVKWTLHDCWAFTGHCTHFTLAQCDKWKTGCNNCTNRREYPASVFVDRSKENYSRKRELFSGINNFTIYTPSEWLKSKVESSFLNRYKIEVWPNTIDESVFKYTKSNIRERYKIPDDNKLIISVASAWTKAKGLEDIIELSKRLDSSKYTFMVVGLDKKQLRKIPQRIIGIGMVGVEELVNIYSAADLLVSASKEETFGLTILEAAACGTKSIVYKDTACEEVALNNDGLVVDQDIESMCRAITDEI